MRLRTWNDIKWRIEIKIWNNENNNLNLVTNNDDVVKHVNMNFANKYVSHIEIYLFTIGIWVLIRTKSTIKKTYTSLRK
jgi:hypothetical protein